MSFKTDLFSAQDDIFDVLDDMVEQVLRSNKPKVKIPAYPFPGASVKAGAAWSPIDAKPYGNSSYGGLDQATFDSLSRKAETAISEPKKQDRTMSLLGNIPGLSGTAFGKVTGNRIAVGFDGQVVFRKPDGSYVKVETDADGNRTQVSVLDLKMDVEFYKVPTQTLTPGDLIELDGQFLYVEENNKGGVKFVNPLTGAKSSKLQQTNILGLHFYSKIVSLFDLAGGQQGGLGLNGINPMMLMALQGKGGSGGDITELLLLSSLAGAQGQNGANPLGGINPMMLMMLGDKSENDTMKQFMMLQMFAGQGGANPFAPVSANVANAPVVAKAAPRKAAAKKTATKAAPKKSKTAATPVVSIASPVKAASKKG